MRERWWKRTGRMAVVLGIVAGLLSQGCFLTKKTIVDVYTAVHGVPVNTPFLVNEMAFGGSYCIPPGRVSVSMGLKPFAPAMTALLLQVYLLTGTGPAALVMEALLEGKKGKFKGGFDLDTQVCVAAGDTLQWVATPLGGDILPNAALTSKLTYKAAKPK